MSWDKNVQCPTKYNQTPHLRITREFESRILMILKEIIGKTFSDINRISVFLGQSPKAIDIKINKWDLIKKKKEKKNFDENFFG